MELSNNSEATKNSNKSFISESMSQFNGGYINSNNNSNNTNKKSRYELEDPIWDPFGTPGLYLFKMIFFPLNI